MKAKAFAPGHITGFFEICEHDDFHRCGSRGAGLCLSKGVVSEVYCEQAQAQKIHVYANGVEVDGEVVKKAIRNLIGTAPYYIKVHEEVQLPISQGFGMSAAGALSTVFALAHALHIKKSYWDLVFAAHKADIECKGGLGDVVCSATGGVDIRKKPGIPPHGFVDRIAVEQTKISIAVIGEEIHTKKVLTDAGRRKTISRYGAECMKNVLEEPNMEKLFELSYQFAVKTGLASKDVMDILGELWKNNIPSSMCMLGNSIFALGKKKDIQRIAGEAYHIEELEIDFCGARIV